MIPFEQFWILHNPSAEYAHMHRFCKKIWESIAEKVNPLTSRLKRKVAKEK